MEQKREIQAELFQEVGKHPEKRKEGHRSQPIGKRYGILFNLSYENIAFVIIALILVIAIVFSLGVEKGKRLAIYKNPQKTQTITADVQPKEVRPQIVKVEKKN